MSQLLYGLVLVVLVAAAAFGFMVWRGFAQNWRPADLKAGKVVLVEDDLFTNAPYPVVGRPDQVYRLPNGLHVPVENKNRDFHRVYETDIAELSLQAWLLRLNGMPTASYGYVAANSRRTGVRKALKVELRGDAYCEGLIRRYLDLIDGRVKARASRGRKCDTCGHRGVC